MSQGYYVIIHTAHSEREVRQVIEDALGDLGCNPRQSVIERMEDAEVENTLESIRKENEKYHRD